jgi:hypothetical protein
MTLMKKGVLTAVIIGAAASALADWDTNDPAKWFQLPDLRQGMDVRATWPKILADDFKCTFTGPITDIHLWGSWLNNQVDPNVRFHLSFHADVPAGIDPAVPWSHPGSNLWSLNLAPTKSRIYAEASERFYDPNLHEFIGFDTQVWQYNFLIPATEAFFQREGTIYWLDVTAFTTNGVFGWKTSFQHWNDDAVWGDVPASGGPPQMWYELRDPTTQLSMDLAFVLTTIPEPSAVALIGFGCVLVLMRRWKR